MSPMVSSPSSTSLLYKLICLGRYSFRMSSLESSFTSPHLITQINGVVFTSYSFFMKLQLPADSGQEPSLGQICLAGAGSGLASS